MPYGEEIARTGYGQDSVREKFATYERDEETDLDFAQARYFNTALGRYHSPDPETAGADFAEPQSWNGYSYVVNNPLMYADPLGLWKQVECSSGKGKCWEAERGDTFESLAKLVDIPAKFLKQFFSDVDPRNIQIGQTFDLSGYEYWAITTSFARMGVDVERGPALDWNDPRLVQDIPKEWQPDKPTGNPIRDGIPPFLQGAEDALAIFLATRGGGRLALASGLRGASPGLLAIFGGGSIRNSSIINIRNTLLQNGFKMTSSQRGSGYLFRNSAGEEVRIMRRNGGWDVRIKNGSGNYLDEFGNVAPPAQTHGITVFPR